MKNLRLGLTLVLTVSLATVARADSAKDNRAEQPRPIKLGTSGGAAADFFFCGALQYCASGTLGGLVQRDGRPFLVGFETRDGHDLAALFRLNLRLDTPRPQVGLTKLGEREFLCRGGCGFAAGAGASIEDGRLVFYSVEHRTRGRSLRLYRFRPASSIE